MRLMVVFSVALCGCATAPPLWSSPAAKYTTTKAPQEIAQCLENSFGAVAIVRRGNRAAITSRDAKLSVRVYDNGSVEVWRPKPLHEQSRSHIQSCM